MSFAVNVDEIKDYKDTLKAPGKYQVEVVKAKEGVTRQGGPGSRPKIDLTLKVLDTIPAGEDIDEDEYENPLDQMVFASIYFPREDDKKNTKNLMMGNLRDYLNNFEVEPEDPNSLGAEDFMGCIGGVEIKHQKRDKNDPNSPLTDRINNSVPID